LSLAGLQRLQPAAPPKLLQQTDTPTAPVNFSMTSNIGRLIFSGHANPRTAWSRTVIRRVFRERRGGRVCADGLSIGVERGYVIACGARDRVLKTLRFFRDAPQGLGAKGFAGYKGFYYHFLDMGNRSAVQRAV